MASDMACHMCRVDRSVPCDGVREYSPLFVRLHPFGGGRKILDERGCKTG